MATRWRCAHAGVTGCFYGMGMRTGWHLVVYSLKKYTYPNKSTFLKHGKKLLKQLFI